MATLPSAHWSNVLDAPTRIAGSPARPNESPQVVACQSVRVLYLIIFPRPALPASALSRRSSPLVLLLSLSFYLSRFLCLSFSFYIARCLTPVCVEAQEFSLQRESQESRRITLQSSTCAALVRIVRVTPVAFTCY